MGRSITLILGGVSSGKSRYARDLASRANEVVFLATALPCDEEMRSKIRRHVQERPPGWTTVEAPFELDDAVAAYAAASFLIIECLTTYIANLLVVQQTSSEQILSRIEVVSQSLLSSRASVAIVSNEVGSGIVPEYPAGRQFRDLLGKVNQRMACICDNVILMVAGCPLAVKGKVELSS